MVSNEKWIGVDLDACLAYIDDTRQLGSLNIGAPIDKMVSKVKDKLDKGRHVKIFTARVAGLFISMGAYHLQYGVDAKKAIEEWCLKVFGQVLEVTAVKDYQCVEIWDDRAKQVIPNTGVFLEEMLAVTGCGNGE